MGWVVAICVALVAWAFYWPVGLLQGHVGVPVALTGALLLALGYVRSRRILDAAALERGIFGHGERRSPRASPDREGEIQALRGQFLEGIDALKKMRPGKRGRADALHSRPWYVLIGPPGAGKTTALEASGLSFSPLGPNGARARGVGGTRNCDWWLADEAVLLDTAGRYTTEPDDQEEWLSFLGLLRRHRGRCPINGVIVAVSVPDLVDAGEDGIQAHAKQIRGRIDELMKQLDMIVPVYVLFTKVDLIAGFLETFGDLKKSERKQPWGATLRLSADRSDPRALFEAELDVLLRRVHALSIERLASRPAPPKCDRIHRFPLELRNVREALAELVATLFAVNPYQGDPLFRGFYFTSGTQEGRPLERVLRRMEEAMDIAPREPEAPEPRQAKSYFLHDVFVDIVFKDAPLAALSPGRVRRDRLSRLAVAAVAGALAVLLCAMAVVSFARNREMLVSIQAESAKDVEWRGRTSQNVGVLSPILGQLRRLDAHREEGVPIDMAWMMYQGERVREPMLRSYLAHLQSGFVVPCKRAIEERLRLANGEEYLAERRMLKMYLMLDDSAHGFEHVDVEWATGHYTDLWFGLLKGAADTRPEELRRQVAEHVRYYFTLFRSGRVAPAPIDGDLVAEVRSILAKVPLTRRYYDELVTSVAEQKIDDALGDEPANLRYPALTLAGIFSSYPGVLRHVGSAQHEEDGGWKRVEGPYTELGHRAVVGNIALGRDLLAQDAWVVPLGLDKVAADIEVAASEYERRYIDAWMGFLSDVTPRSPRTLREAVVLYRALATAPWPYATLLRALQDHTQWPTTTAGRDRTEQALALAKVLKREKLPGQTKGVSSFVDALRIGDRVSAIPPLFSGTVAFGVPQRARGPSEHEGLAVTPLAKYIARLDALRRQIEEVLDGDEHAPPRLLAGQLDAAAREAEALVAAQIASSPVPDRPDTARALLQWLWCPLRVGDVRLPSPRLVPARIKCR